VRGAAPIARAGSGQAWLSRNAHPLASDGTHEREDFLVLRSLALRWVRQIKHSNCSWGAHGAWLEPVSNTPFLFLSTTSTRSSTPLLTMGREAPPDGLPGRLHPTASTPAHLLPSSELTCARHQHNGVQSPNHPASNSRRGPNTPN
jgi:hypothetical protein